MAKPKQRNKRERARAAAQANAPDTTRRALLNNLPLVAGGAVLLGGAGVWGVTAVQADLAEQDLSILGDGTPTIVQIHDPTCPICTALRKETHAALAMMEPDQITYRVANIKSDTGSVFASLHNSSHATLLLFDGAGNLTQRVHGMTDRDALYSAFTTHVGRENE